MQHFRTTTPAQLALPFPAGSLRRIDPAQNAARFYSMDVERDLFGRVVLGACGPYGDRGAEEAPGLSVRAHAGRNQHENEQSERYAAKSKECTLEVVLWF